MTVLNHIAKYSSVDSNLIDAFKETAMELTQITQLLEKKDYSSTTYTERTRLYNWWEGTGCNIIAPSAYIFNRIDFNNDIEITDFTCENDGVSLVHDFIFTNFSVTLPTIDTTDFESVAVDMITSSMIEMYLEHDKTSYAYLSMYNQLQSLYKDNVLLPQFDIRGNIVRGLKPFIAGEE